jgi:hypothetical protein
MARNYGRNHHPRQHSELLVAIHTSRQYCHKAGEAGIFTPVRESSGESRLMTLALVRTVECHEFAMFPGENLETTRRTKLSCEPADYPI